MTFDDVTMPAEYKLNEQSLKLNGAGVREKFFLDLYIGGLYLQSPSTSADGVIKADKPMSIKLHIISGLIDSDKMIDASISKKINDLKKELLGSSNYTIKLN